VLLWKEYRQQRVFWLVITGLALLLLFSVAEIMGQGSGLDVFRDVKIKQYLFAVLCVLAVIHGVATGALLLAGDKEDGALVFLDSLTGKRGPIFVTKIGAGLFLTLSEMLVFACMSTVMGFGTWQLTGSLLAFGLDGLVWGLLAGAICRTSLTAVLAGLGLWLASWPLTLLAVFPLIFLVREFDWVWARRFTNSDHLPLAGKIAVGLAAGFVSWRIYCRDDFARQPSQSQLKSKLLAMLPSDWRVLLWLAYRQGRVALAACLVTSVVVGLAILLSPLHVWPVGMMIVGLAAGLAAFVPEQRNGNLFQGTQRFSAGSVWTAKILFWAMVAAGLTCVAWLMAAMATGSVNPQWWLARSQFDWERFTVSCGDPVLFFCLWPLYGFCFGLFFGQVTGRAVIALVLAAFIAPLAAAMWVPSLLTGGVPAWQVIIIPALLVLTTRFTQWPAMSGRLLTWRPMLAICAALTLAIMSLAGCLWYRVTEVPYGGEPFDVKAFVASLPSNQNLAGGLIREAATDLTDEERFVGTQKQPSEVSDEWPAKKLERALRHVVDKGWSNDDQKQIGPWLDRLFKGEWAEKAQQAANLPLGMVEDPRLADPVRPGQTPVRDYERLANLLVARALQLQAQGDSRAALDYLAAVLALSRQVQNYASGTVLDSAFNMESSALSGLRHWLRNVGPDKELLQAAQVLVEEHKKSCPDLANSIKASYLIYRNGGPTPSPGWSILGGLVRAANGAPWEKDRQKRIAQDIVAAQLQAIKEPIAKYYNAYRKLLHQRGGWDILGAAMNNGLPPKDGPGSELTDEQWTELVNQCGYRYYPLFRDMQRAVYNRERLPINATQIVIALARYQADHGKPPVALREIVPDYMAELPFDPDTGENFGYAISTGGVIDEYAQPPLILPVGQAYFWSGKQPAPEFCVPIWAERKEK
jgi:hypothetical protein